MSGLFNYQEANVDWIINLVKELYAKTENEFQGMLKEYMQKFFEGVSAEILYDEADKRIDFAIGDYNPVDHGKTVEEFAVQNEILTMVDKTARASIQSIQDSIPTLFSNAVKLKNRKFLFISDSYGTGGAGSESFTPWTVLLTNQLNNGSRWIAEGGSGFVHTRTFLTLLQEKIGTIPDKNTFTDVVVCGGYNDRGYEAADIEDAIGDFFNYAKAQFPNAVMHLGCIGWNCNSAESSKVAGVVWPSYRRGADNNWVHYLTGIEYAMHDYGLFAQDGLHPNQDGQQKLSVIIAGALLYSSYKMHSFRDVAYDVRDGSDWNKTANLTEFISGDVSALASGGTTLNYSQPINLTQGQELAIMKKGLREGVVKGGTYNTYASIPVYISINGAVPVISYLNFKRGTYGDDYFNMIYIYPLTSQTGVTRIQIFPFRGILPSAQT